jgi:hypothetical protein
MATITRKPQRPLIKEPQLLVFEEKHGNRYFYIPDDKTLAAAALKVLTERYEEGYWYYEPGEKPKAPDFTKEQITTLPESMRPAAEKKLREYEAACRQYATEVEDYERIVKAVKTKDGKLAWKALYDRQDGEYERVKLERLESIEE